MKNKNICGFKPDNKKRRVRIFRTSFGKTGNLMAALRDFTVMSFLITMTACSTSTVNISTSPQKAKVFARAIGKGELKEIGETPLTLDAHQISKMQTHSGPVSIELQKTGYQTERILITEFSHLDLTIHEDLHPASGLEDPHILNDTIDHLFEAQRLAKQKRFEDSLKELAMVSSTSPQISAVYEMRGGIFFIQKKYVEALDDYNHLVILNSKNTEARAMVDRLKSLLEPKTESANGTTHP